MLLEDTCKRKTIHSVPTKTSFPVKIISKALFLDFYHILNPKYHPFEDSTLLPQALSDFMRPSVDQKST